MTEEDVAVNPDACRGASCTDAMRSDTGDASSVEMDGAIDDVPGAFDVTSEGSVADDGGGGDVSVTEAGLPDGGVTFGRCVPVGTLLQLSTEARQRARTISLGTHSAGYWASWSWLNAGATQVSFAQISATGARIGMDTNVVPEFLGSVVGGGGFAATPSGFSVALHSNFDMGLDIYLQRLTAMGARVGTPVRVVTDRELSELPDVIRTATGEVVVWRSTDDMATSQRLLASLVVGSTARAPISLTPMGMQASSFDVAFNATNAVVAMVSRRDSNGDVNLVTLNPDGTVVRTVPLTTSAFVSEPVAVTLLGGDAIVAWTERTAQSTLKLRRVNLTTGIAGPLVHVPEVGFEISQVGLELDRDGVVVAFRAPTMLGGSIAIARLGPTLALREGVSRVAPGGPGDAVTVASRGDGTFGVAWADEVPMPMRTTANFQVMRCP
ncbi:MAG: hypothetical protein Q8Q09_09320 [Deltaproteobacteria bacterium]|nr:hypothetical protein [Deltaproteobacteria bacterium]